MPNKTPRIYISAMETEVTGLPRFDPQAAKLLAKLSEIGYDIFWEKQWRDYEVVEKEVTACDALLAVVNSAWLTSVRMEKEVIIAMKNSSLVFLCPIYPLGLGASLRFPFNLRGPHRLEDDIEVASATIREHLPIQSEASGTMT